MLYRSIIPIYFKFLLFHIFLSKILTEFFFLAWIVHLLITATALLCVVIEFLFDSICFFRIKIPHISLIAMSTFRFLWELSFHDLVFHIFHFAFSASFAA